jgi:5-methyltetrahydropteroyltriglutamate--homocysteine methyltransferase
MKRSTDRILTTHTGSLPRPKELERLISLADARELSPVDADALPGAVRDGVADVVDSQVKSRVDVVNDGEASKIGYATYVRERLTGFDGEGQMPAPTDLLEFPELVERVFSELSFATPACTGPVEYVGADAVQTDTANLKAALDGKPHEDAFISAASPGVISLFLPNQHYASHEEYLFALADAMKHEYDAINEAGFIVQIDCPDLAMGRHIQFGPDSVEVFRTNIERHVEALNHATRDIPAENLRMHLCWGNYDGPHHHDVELGDIIDIVLKARPSAISLESANPRHAHDWTVFQDTKLPDGKVLLPGVVDSTNNYIEHPAVVAERIVRFADVVGREQVIASSDCGFATFATYHGVHPGIAWAKLAAMAEGAELASQQLWA